MAKDVVALLENTGSLGILQLSPQHRVLVVEVFTGLQGYEELAPGTLRIE